MNSRGFPTAGVSTGWWPEVQVPKTRWATTIDGASIAYQVFGEGPLTIVVIHPWASHLEVYWEQPRFVRFMKRLSLNMRVVHLDKRGMGMSDRILEAPDVGILMEDIRAVMDAAEVERGVVFGWGGTGSAPLAALFAATHPERTIALWLDGAIHERWEPDFPLGTPPEELERGTEEFAAIWGDDDHAVECAQWCYGDRPEDCPVDDPVFLAWWTKMLRYSATPTAMITFSRMWDQTDVRGVLSSIHVPTAVACKTNPDDAGSDEVGQQGWALFNVEHIPGAQLIEIPGAAHVIWMEDPEPYVSALEAFLASFRDEQADLERTLATVLFTDIVDSTSTAAVMGDARWREAVAEHDSIAKSVVARYRGEFVRGTGDGMVATFDGPARAVRCAQAIVEAVKPLSLEVRAGAHTGEITYGGNDLAGIGVHVAARVASMAGPSEVWASSTVKDLTVGSTLTFVDVGVHELKGVPDRWHLYRVVGS